jgi:hypothetical protein
MSRNMTVRLKEDRPGAFSAVAEALSAGGVNIEGVTQMDGVVNVLVPDGAVARRALESAGLQIEGESDPVVVKLEDRPGELAGVTKRLANAGVSLRVVYLATNTRVVFVADDPDRAREELGT